MEAEHKVSCGRLPARAPKIVDGAPRGGLDSHGQAGPCDMKLKAVHLTELVEAD